jgi:hypothetical protein
VITPTFNAEKHLERCLLSIASQTYRNFEIVVIDGGSTDRTLDILRGNDLLIDYWSSESDSGVFDAMNKGLQQARGDVIVILNADDFFVPDAIELSIASLLENHCDYTVSGCSFIDEAEKIAWVKLPEMPQETAKFHFSTASHQTYFVRKECYASIGNYDNAYKIAADYKFRNLMHSHKFSFSVVPGILVYCSTGGLSTRPENRELCLAEVYQIATETTGVVDLRDIEFLIHLVSERQVPSRAVARLRAIVHKYDMPGSLRRALECNLFEVLSVQESSPTATRLAGLSRLPRLRLVTLLARALKKRILPLWMLMSKIKGRIQRFQW